MVHRFIYPHKVGIIPKENIQQVDFAFNIYGTTGYEGYKLSQEFKQTFAYVAMTTFIRSLTLTQAHRPWLNLSVSGKPSSNNIHRLLTTAPTLRDTVSSVGIIPRVSPYTSVNYGIKTFRHALALDERRSRFRPNVWSEVTPGREQELDVDIPEPAGIPPKAKRDNWAYIPPNRDFANVEEVWFAGKLAIGHHSPRWH